MKKSGFSIVYEGKRAGLKNRSGEVVLPCEYDQILDFDDDGYVRFLKHGRYGTVDLEGKVCIPLSAGLTHLGVFYKGKARARIDGLWGLVDVMGKRVTDFVYASMHAHYGNGYSVVTTEGKRGWLTDNGIFTPSNRPPKLKGVEYHPQLVSTHHYSLFEEDAFLKKLSSWMGGYFDPLEFYYRDTDAEMDVDSLYKRGKFVRTDGDLLVTQKLLRPVHKVRFLIAARRWLSTGWGIDDRRDDGRPVFLEYRIPAFTNFLVVDVQHYGGVTQVVLLHFPHGALLLAKKFKVKFSKFKPLGDDHEDLKLVALHDLQQKCGKDVHGHSLLPAWCEAMYQPVGCDEKMCLNPLLLKPYDARNRDFLGDGRELELLHDGDAEWAESYFIKIQPYTIKLYKGDMTRRVGDLMVRFVGSDDDAHDGFAQRFTAVANQKLLDECAQHLPKNPGAVLLTDAYDLPYKKILHLRWSDNFQSSVSAVKFFKSCFDRMMEEAEKLEVRSIVIPARTWGNSKVVSALVDTLVLHMKNKKYVGDIEIFSECDADLESYKAYLDAVGDFDS